jgi:hypothetical protein
MVVISREFLRMASEMGKEFGKKVLETAINMKDNIQTIRRAVMEFSRGLRATFTKETIKVI